MARKLTPKQAEFVRQYLVDLNATQAAIRAGYSKKTADKIGPELLGKTSVREAVAKAQEKRAERVGRTAEDVLRDIQSVTKSAIDSGDIKNALKGLELEGKHLGMFTDRVRQEVSGPDDGPVQHAFTVRFVAPEGE